MHTIDEVIVLTRLLTDLRAARTNPADLGLLIIINEVGELANALASEGPEAVQRVALRLAVSALRVSLDGDPAMDDIRRKVGLGATSLGAMPAPMPKPNGSIPADTFQPPAFMAPRP